MNFLKSKKMCVFLTIILMFSIMFMSACDLDVPVDSSNGTENQNFEMPSNGKDSEISFDDVADDKNTSKNEETETQSKVPEESKKPTHVHNFEAATCVKARTCSCGATEGKANGHHWNMATCTTPKKCSVCGATDGEKADHNWKFATCTTAKVCALCGLTSGSAKGHSYSDGACSSCGAEDPNYAREAMVWIPVKGGKKYHSHAGCSNMIDPVEVTEKEAINQSFGPCGRCY